MTGFARVRVNGGSFVVGIGVGDDGRRGREKIVLPFLPPIPLPQLPPDIGRVAGPRWLRKSLLGCGRSTGRSTNWSKTESVRETRSRIRIKLGNGSFYLLGIPSLGRGNRNGPRTVQAVIRESDG